MFESWESAPDVAKYFQKRGSYAGSRNEIRDLIDYLHNLEYNYIYEPDLKSYRMIIKLC